MSVERRVSCVVCDCVLCGRNVGGFFQGMLHN